MSWIPDNTTLEQLKCTTCKNYLSVGPVTQTHDGYNCGRCFVAGDGIITIFEILAKNCRFSCRYDISGCGAKLTYGEEVVNHEKTCEYRMSSCPVGDSCEWTGAAVTSFDHCSNEHKECVVAENNDFEFNVNLRESVNKKSIMRGKSGELLLLHLMYSEEMGLSASIKLFVIKNQEKVVRYTLLLQSSDKKNLMQLENREVTPYSSKPSLEWIPFNALCCLDKTVILASIKVESEKNQNQSAAVFTCDKCNNTNPQYVFRCSSNHRFCDQCRNNIVQFCNICSTYLQFRGNINPSGWPLTGNVPEVAISFSPFSRNCSVNRRKK